MHEQQIPSPIHEAIRDAAESRDSFSVACRLFIDDASDSCPADHLARGRLEQAVARATLEAWRHGLGSAASVGQAYAAVANTARARVAPGVSPSPLRATGLEPFGHPRA